MIQFHYLHIHTNRRFSKIHFDGFKDKFNVYAPFIEKLNIFTQIINGMEVIKNDKLKLNLNLLSSGEK